GRRYQRVRIVPEPLTDYLRYALRGTRQTVEAGEDIRYLPQARANELDLPDHDYWLFDDTRLALLHFTADDRPLGATLSTEPGAAPPGRRTPPARTPPPGPSPKAASTRQGALERPLRGKRGVRRPVASAQGGCGAERQTAMVRLTPPAVIGWRAS